MLGQSPAAGQPDLTSALERELGAEDTELAKELQRTRAEEIIARRRIAIERMRGGQPAPDPSGGKTADRPKEWLTDIAAGLLDKKLDPGVVGRTIDYLLGVAAFPQVGLPGAPAPAQGMTFENMRELYKMGMEANRIDPTLTTILTKLTEKVEAIEKIAAARPAVQPERKTAFVIRADNTLEEVPLDRPILLEPKPAAEGSKPIEVVKEENRHAEETERLKIDKEHKKDLADALGNISKNIGRGMAAQALGEEEEGEPAAGAVAKTAEQDPFKCEKCGAEFMIPADALQITCPNCTEQDGSPTVYTRKKKV